MFESFNVKDGGCNNWEPPRGYALSDESDYRDLNRLLAKGYVDHVVDPLTEISEDLFELRHPELQNDMAARSNFVEEFSRDSDGYGVWFYFPWRRSLVRYPNEKDHYDLRTYRNKPLISEAEQARLHDSTVAIFGLSVGSNVVDSLVQAGIGGTLLIGDSDIVTPTNLNRIRASMQDVGLAKTTVTGRKVSEIDPYISQIHLRDGYADDTDLVLEKVNPSVIVEEVDDLSVKAELRRAAGRLAIPLVMAGDIGERSIVDIERHDDGEVRPFNGKISQSDYEMLLSGNVSVADQERILVKINGLRNLSPRLIDASMRRGIDIAGFPQLGSVASMGASIATVAIRDILTGGALKSGSYVANPRRMLRLGSQQSPLEAASIVHRFLTRHKP